MKWRFEKSPFFSILYYIEKLKIMIGNPDIYWIEQCNYCLRSINTTHCNRNQAFMEKLKSMYSEYLGTVEFVCDYFTIDKLKLVNLCEKEQNIKSK